MGRGPNYQAAIVRAPYGRVWCACGGWRKPRAARCFQCKEDAAKARRTCECGNTKAPNAKRCMDCRRKEPCACGKPKSSDAKQCRSCYGAKHGTESGYYRHLRGRKGEKPSVPCQRCCDAHAAANRARTGGKPLNRQPKKSDPDKITWVPRKGTVRAA